LPNGRLVEFGGTTPLYSDDEGQTWSKVVPVTPLVNGEGAVVAGPGGSVLAIGWDPYSGDHLQAFKYDPSTDTWYVAEVPLHSPFYDRPWITVAPGPWHLDDGSTSSYLTLVRGGYPSKDPELASTDGLAYTTLTSPALDSAQDTTASGPLPDGPNPLADYWQPHPGAGTLPLTDGGLLQLTQAGDGDLASCPLTRLRTDTGTWQCYDLPTLDSGITRQDSRGWLTRVLPSDDGRQLQVRISKDGGESWGTATTLIPPNHGTLEAPLLTDIKVNGALGIAAISARFDDAAGHGQDMVFRLDVSRTTPRWLDTAYLGLGDIVTANDASGSAGDRFDFASVAILPDGHIAASYQDSTTLDGSSHNPWLAISR
jgi:hypothetical protein